MKRIGLLFLTAVLLFSLITACSSGNTLVDFLGEEETGYNFGGVTFRITDAGSSGGGMVLVPDPYTGSVAAEKLYARYKQIENDCNCVISISESEGRPEEFMPSYYAGIPYANLMNLRIKGIYNLYSANLLRGYNEIPGVDLSDGKYGSEKLITALTWKDKTVGVFPAYWGVMTPNFSDGLYYNPGLCAQLSLATPNELYEQGKWDWDALRVMAETAAAASTENDPLYLSVLNNYFARMMVLSNDGRYITRDDNGQLTFKLADQNVIDALNYTNDLYKNGYLVKYTGDVGSALGMFVNGNLLMVAEYSVQGISADGGEIGTKMEDEYCWTYAPRGPDGTDMTMGVISTENQYIVATIEEVDSEDAFGQFISLLFDPLFDTPDGWVESYLNMNFYDDASREVFMTKYENCIFDYVIFAYDGDALFDTLKSASEKGNAVQALSSIKDRVNKTLEGK